MQNIVNRNEKLQSSTNERTTESASKSSRSSKSVKIRYVEGITIKSDGANSPFLGGSPRKLREKMLTNLINRVGKFEIYYYTIYILAGLLCLVIIPFTWMLVASLFAFFLALYANNLVARGYRYGLIISAIEMFIYVFISIVTKVWGEVFINLLVFIPLEIQGYIKWKEATVESSGKINEIKKLDIKGWIYVIIATTVITFITWTILGLLVHQANALINALSISLFIVATYIRNSRYIEVWYLFLVGNIISTLLWVLVATSIDVSVLPLILSCTSLALNNINGLAVWHTLYKTCQKTSGKLLAKRKVSVKRIKKLKNMFSKMKCKEL